MSLDPPVNPSRLRRLQLRLMDARLDLIEGVQAVLADPERVRRGLIAAGVLIVIVLLTTVAILLTWYGRQADSDPSRPVLAAEAPAGLPSSPVEFTLTPDQLRALSADQARVLNASLPVSLTPDTPAPPFILSAGTLDFQRAVDCLTAAVYYEAANETVGGQQAVAQVVLNRVRHAAYPGTVCGVVFQGSERQTGCQFSFTCDGALGRSPEQGRWASARATAVAALSGTVSAAVGHATHYHADYVSPYWAPRLDKVGQIGVHIFYRWRGQFGRPAAFAKTYRGGEPDVAKLKPLAAAGFGFPALAEIIDLEPVSTAASIDLVAGTTAMPIVVSTDIEDGPAEPKPDTAAVVQAPTPVVVRIEPAVPTTRNGEVTSTVTDIPRRPSRRLARPSGW